MLVISKTSGTVHHKKVSRIKECYAREKRDFSLELDMTLTCE